MQNTSKKLFDLLQSKDYTVKTLDASGKEETDFEEVEMFSFDFEVGGKNFGTIVILLNSSGDMEIFFGDTIGKTLDGPEKDAWVDLMFQLRMFSKRNMMGFKLENINRLKYSMRTMAQMNESYKNIFESYYGTSKTSYNPQGKAKIIIKHSKPIKEGDKRYLNINEIFIENEAGERFKLPFKKIAGAKAMARHVTEGGNPYDIFGVHISETVSNINTLSGFVRKSKMFEDNDDTMELVEAGREHYATLRKNLKQMSLKRGYNTYKEGWSPDAITETDIDVDGIKALFTQDSINSKVLEALPLIAKLTSRRTEQLEEVGEFEEWADGVVDGSTAINEGTWALPEDDDAINILVNWFSEEQLPGINALNVTDALYEILGNDELYDILLDFSDKHGDEDVRPVVLKWIEKYTDKITNTSTDLLRDTIPELQKQLGLTEHKDLDSDQPCLQQCPDDKVTNKGHGMEQFKNYLE